MPRFLVRWAAMVLSRHQQTVADRRRSTNDQLAASVGKTIPWRKG